MDFGRGLLDPGRMSGEFHQATTGDAIGGSSALISINESGADRVHDVLCGIAAAGHDAVAAPSNGAVAA
jgi:hypothetical protein